MRIYVSTWDVNDKEFTSQLEGSGKEIADQLAQLQRGFNADKTLQRMAFVFAKD
jgi:hypothetical protein